MYELGGRKIQFSDIMDLLICCCFTALLSPQPDCKKYNGKQKRQTRSKAKS
jgi:hypothetical protein